MSRKDVCCHNFIPYAVTSIKAMSLVRIYPGRGRGLCIKQENIMQGAMTKCMEKKEMHLGVEKWDPEVVKNNDGGEYMTHFLF